ncbi:MAG TPA: hypothetical protein DDY58_17990 [Terrisporobacter glycolicus]|nr:hypothetical protein [Terrisporobacter hibernicus]
MFDKIKCGFFRRKLPE